MVGKHCLCALKDLDLADLVELSSVGLARLAGGDDQGDVPAFAGLLNLGSMPVAEEQGCDLALDGGP